MARTAIKGLAQLKRKLADLPQIVIDEVKAAMEVSAAEIVALAQSLVAVDKGELKKSIGWTWGPVPKGALTIAKVKAPKAKGNASISIYAGNTEAFYARWVEFGTSAHEQGGLFDGTMHPGTKAQPYFFPAFRANRKKAKSRVRAAVRRGAKKVAAGGGS